MLKLVKIITFAFGNLGNRSLSSEFEAAVFLYRVANFCFGDIFQIQDRHIYIYYLEFISTRWFHRFFCMITWGNDPI